MLNWLTRRALSAWRRAQGKPFVTRAAAAKLPTEYGEFDIVVYEDSVDPQTHVADSRITASVGLIIVGTLRSSKRTSPDP